TDCVLVLSLISSLTFGIPDELSHQLSGNIKGRIIFHQMEDNSTYLRDSGKLASYIPTLVSFEHFDPRHTLHSLSHTEVRKGPEPFVKCHYTSSGNYTFQLSIEANTPQNSRWTGLYSIDLTVLDAIKTIELRGALIYNVDQSSIKKLFGTWECVVCVDFYSVVWLCWRVLSECYTPSPTSCNLVRLYGNIFNLNYTFRSVGPHCLDLSVRNNISNLQTSYNIYVQSSPVSLIFILPCAAVIVATLIFISVSVCRPRQQSLMSKALVITDCSFNRISSQIDLLLVGQTIILKGVWIILCIWCN
uniref:Uncharacterized protein n=1 Tax=Sinocyclocheilus grahami TaxID=75366 RepID=A0A672KS22_SINGR